MYACSCGERYDVTKVANCPKCGQPPKGGPGNAGLDDVGCVAGEGPVDDATADQADLAAGPDDGADAVEAGGYKCADCGTVVNDADVRPGQPTYDGTSGGQGMLCPSCLACRIVAQVHGGRQVACDQCAEPVTASHGIDVRVYSVKDGKATVPAALVFHHTCVARAKEDGGDVPVPPHSTGLAFGLYTPAKFNPMAAEQEQP